MKKIVLAWRCVIAAVLIAFLVLSPEKLLVELERNPYREFLGGKDRDSWSGIITVWHVVGFKTYQGSVTSFLEGCAARYEKSHPGVYIEVAGMSKENAMERISRGERPDIWSVPMSELSLVDCLTLTTGGMSFDGSLRPDGAKLFEKEGEIKAFPYLMSGYYLIGNSVLSANLGLGFPTKDNLKETLQSAMDSNSTTRFGALCADVILAAGLGVTGKLASDGDFKAGQVPFMIGDARALGDISRKKDSFSVDILALGGYTDQVQYVGIEADIATERVEHAKGFIELLLSEQEQAKLTALGAIPVIGLADPPSYTITALTSLFEAYKEPSVPDPALYSLEKDMLIIEAEGAVNGDTSAKDSFGKRMAEMMGN